MSVQHVRVELPLHLMRLANMNGHETTLDVTEPVTLRAVLEELERRYPALEGTMRDHVTKKRRDFLRFFVCQEDWSHRSPDELLPEAIVNGEEPLLVIGAIAGG